MALHPGSVYCAGMYVNRQEDCPKAVDGFGLYFGGAEIDTIKYNARLPLTFLTPQVQNPNGNIINDAVNWIPVSGTFVATGSEKYLVIGNFKSDAATNLAATGFSTSSLDWSEYFVDQVWCIELDPHFAGPDTTLLPGDSLFIGKTNDDDWLDASFTWYNPPQNNAIDSTTGFWVKPSATSTYVVKQEICSYTIWDTIVVKIKEDDVRVAEMRTNSLRVFPVPAGDRLTIQTDASSWFEGYTQYTICNSIHQKILMGTADLSGKKFEIDTSALQSGVYTFVFSGPDQPPVSKRLLIAR